MLTCYLPLVFFFLLFLVLYLCLVLTLASCLGRLEPIGHSKPTFQSELFPSEKNKELYETLNIKRKIWVEHKVLLDELNPAIRANF